MTSFEIRSVPFSASGVRSLEVDRRATNWPVVYTLNNRRAIYVGQTTNSVARLLQHLAAKKDLALREVRILLDEEFNVSAALDLEAHLIRWFAADQRFTPVNANAGVVDRDYFDRGRYRKTFAEIFDALRDEGMFSATRAVIENTELFKFSPFKSLTEPQAAAVESILEGLFDDLNTGDLGPVVVQGGPGTGKSVIAVTLMKMLSDIHRGESPDEDGPNLPLSEFFGPEYTELLRDHASRFAFVAPQPGLRRTLQQVFARTPGLSRDMVLSPQQVGDSSEAFDLLIVDEAHRLTGPGDQGSGFSNSSFSRVQQRLFGSADADATQLDWLIAQSRHQVLFVDPDQTVRPRDVATTTIREIATAASRSARHYRLVSQLRMNVGDEFIDFLKQLVAGEATAPIDLGTYEVKLFDDAGALQDAIRAKDAELGLARLSAGFAWDWTTQADPDLAHHDFTLDGRAFRWNSKSASETGWVHSPNAVNEVGSIHTVQGFDLTYAGVIIGPDLRYDATAGRTVFHPESYRDKAGGERNRNGGRVSFSVNEIERFVRNVYVVLMTRGIEGLYLYVCDPALREYFRRFFPTVA